MIIILQLHNKLQILELFLAAEKLKVYKSLKFSKQNLQKKSCIQSCAEFGRWFVRSEKLNK